MSSPAFSKQKKKAMSFMDKMDKLKALKNLKKKRRYNKIVKGGGQGPAKGKYYAQGGNVSDSPTSDAVFDKSDTAGGNQTSNYGRGGSFGKIRRPGKPKKRRLKNALSKLKRAPQKCAAYFEDGGRKYANGGGFNTNSGVSSEANFDKEDMAGGNQSANTARRGRRLFGGKKRRGGKKKGYLGTGMRNRAAGACAAYWEDGGRNTAARGRRLFGAGKGYKARRTPLKNVAKGIGNAIRRKPKQCAAYR
jgi:hypothetical protein